MMMKEIHTSKAPAAVGPYSQAIQAGDFIYASGQLGIDPQVGELVDGVENQTKQALENMKVVLAEAGVDFSNVVKFTVYLDSMDDFQAVNEIYGNYMSKPYPARVAVEVSRLPMDALVEMDAIAYKK